MEVYERSSNEIRNAICTIVKDGSQYTITPIAIMIVGDPDMQYDMPDPDGGFTSKGY